MHTIEAYMFVSINSKTEDLHLLVSYIVYSCWNMM